MKARVRGGLDHEWRHADDAAFATRLAVTRQITYDLAAPGGMADMDGILQDRDARLPPRGRRQVHVAFIGRRSRAPVAPPVMRDDAKAVIQEEHLGVPIVGASGQP